MWDLCICFEGTMLRAKKTYARFDSCVISGKEIRQLINGLAITRVSLLRVFDWLRQACAAYMQSFYLT